MEKKIRTDQSGDGSRLPYGWNKGDTCVMITDCVNSFSQN